LAHSSALFVVATDADAGISIMSAVRISASAPKPHIAHITRSLNRSMTAIASKRMLLRPLASTMVKRMLKISPQGILENLK